MLGIPWDPLHLPPEKQQERNVRPRLQLLRRRHHRGHEEARGGDALRRCRGVGPRPTSQPPLSILDLLLLRAAWRPTGRNA